MSQTLVNNSTKQQQQQEDKRLEKGRNIAMTRKIIKINKFVYHVQSETVANKFYIILALGGGPTSCNCPDYQQRKNICKHMYAVMEAIENNKVIDETDKPEILTVKKLSYQGDEYTF